MGIFCLYVLIQKSGQKTAKSHLCSGLAGSALFFVPVYIVKISSVNSIHFYRSPSVNLVLVWIGMEDSILLNTCCQVGNQRKDLIFQSKFEWITNRMGSKALDIEKKWLCKFFPYFSLVYDWNHYLGLGPIPKQKPKLTDTFGWYHNQILKPHFKGRI